MNRVLRMPSPAMVVAFGALDAAISGTAVALPGKNSVDTGDIKKNAVRSSDVKNNSLTGSDVNESKLGQVPSAATANTANSAATANTANSANTANTATNARTLEGIYPPNTPRPVRA